MKIIPTARSTDPETSHLAAASVTPNIRKNQEAVHTILRMYGPCTDEWLTTFYWVYAEGMGLPQQSSSGLRTRRNELVTMGKAEWTGAKVRGSTNRLMRTWRAL